MKKTLIVLLTALLCCLSATSQSLNRQEIVSRHNPHVTSMDPLSALTVGNGGFAFTVDATGLQTFPQLYSQGVPLGTMSDWGWHSFPNTEDYTAEEVLAEKDFGRGRKEYYSAQWKEGRKRDAANYLRANPHRLHLGCVGLNLDDATLVKNIDQTLDLWTGKIDSKFTYGADRYHVETVCAPNADVISTRISSNTKPGLVFRIPYPTGGHADDACDWSENDNMSVDYEHYTNLASIRVSIDTTTYYINVMWRGKARMRRFSPHALLLQSEGKTLDVCFRFSRISYAALSKRAIRPRPAPFSDIYMESAGHWSNYWNNGAIVDFSHVNDPRATELERRVVLSQYLLAVNDAGDTPPQETGLTYNSWFGKFHLEMIWWHQAQFALWGHPEQLAKSLEWYFTALPKAKEIARRQGFAGVRWMKMTDPSGEEAPSNVGSYLIWQQPHPIYLAELLWRANPSMELLKHYAPIVEATAEFMYSYATWDAPNDRYILKGCIPAQETLKADSTVNPPMELSYWLFAMKTAQQWRERMGLERQKDWDRLIEKLSPLAHDDENRYLAAESAPQTYSDIRFISDHPAVLGAVGILPESRLVDNDIMRNTLHWIWDNWNWNKTWGWDYPMTAMCAARLGEPEKAVEALLMDKRTNTYLPNGHNYQDNRLRLYLPGNGGLLTAVAMMCAGWDGSKGKNPGFPASWDVRWEGLKPLP